MEEVQMRLNEKGRGAFYISDGDEQIAEMEIGVADEILTAYHTEVFPKAEGKGLAKKLLATMVEYARKNGLKVNPLCPFVYAHFKRHPAGGTCA